MTEFCIKCERAISIPNRFASLMGSQDNDPVRFKDGWKCASCAKK